MGAPIAGAAGEGTVAPEAWAHLLQAWPWAHDLSSPGL